MKKYLLLLGLIGTINIFAQPCSLPATLFFDDTVVVCDASSYRLTAPVINGAVYTWSNTESGYQTMILANGKYWLRIDDGGCTVSDTIVVLFNSFILSPQVSDVKLCKGKPAGLLPVSGQQLLWYDRPIGGIGNSLAPVPSTADTGSSELWVSQTIRGCESPRVPVTINVIDKPWFELGEPFIIPCNSDGIVLQVVPDHESDYTWSNGSHTESMTVNGRGRYFLYANNMCGDYIDSVQAVECKDRCVQFPTAFSPNGDGANDHYQAACHCPVPYFSLIIYNRNGETVFRTKDATASWNGSFKGQQQPVGSYVFIAEYTDFILKQNFTQKGTLVLVR